MSLDPRNLIEFGGGAEIYSEFSEAEAYVASLAQPRESWLKLDGLSPSLVYRRVYFYAEVKLSVAGRDFRIDGELQFTRNSRLVARLPGSLGRNLQSNNAWGKSAASVASSTAVPGPDCIMLALSYKFAENNSTAFLLPTRIACQADGVTWKITAAVAGSPGYVTTIDNVRAYLAVLSSNAP